MKKVIESCDLKSCYMCRRCINSWIPAIESHRQNILLKKGAAVFEEGDPVKGIYFLLKGKIKVHKRWGNEKQFILQFAKEGDVIGYTGFGNEQVYSVSAITLEKVNLCFIDASFFTATLQVNDNLAYSLLQFYAIQLRQMEKRMGNLIHIDVRGRIADTLLMLKKGFGQNAKGILNIRLTKKELASYSGTTYETFSKMISQLEKERLISLSGKDIAILEESELVRLTS